MWATGHALLIGLRIYHALAPELVTPGAFARAYELLAGLYPEQPSDQGAPEVSPMSSHRSGGLD